MKHKTKYKSYVSVMIIAFMTPFMHLVVYIYVYTYIAFMKIWNIT